MNLRLGTRGSALALVQAGRVARRLQELGHATVTTVISTAGDRAADRAFADVGAFGVFVRDLEGALLDGRIDLAVHSYKDLPSISPAALMVAAVPERADAADVLLVRREALAEWGDGLPLRAGARVGTSAARRHALLRAIRPDLKIGLLRGNVPTRVAALTSGQFDAIVLAAAGLDRLAGARRRRRSRRGRAGDPSASRPLGIRSRAGTGSRRHSGPVRRPPGRVCRRGAQ